jgi:hypothetical protein
MIARLPLTLTLSQWEREQQLPLNCFSKACLANPVARFFKPAEYDSPSSWGEGRGEGEHNIQSV